MKLCYIADANSVHTWRWIRPFVERGDAVHLVSYKPVRDVPHGVAELVDLTELTNTRKIRFIRWGWWLRRYVRRLQPDILHAHQLQAAGWLGVMANYHPFIASSWGSDLLYEPNRSALRRLLVQRVLRACDRLTVPSAILYGAAQEMGYTESNLHLIPWGIETDIFKPTPDDRDKTRKELGIDTDAKVVFCPRKVSPLYNLDTVLEVVKEIAPQEPSLRLVLLRGSAQAGYLAHLEETITAYSLDGIVLWLPRQETAQDMARLYRMCDVVISIPSSEGYGFSVYEAMATGCPTIISDLPVFERELVHGVHAMKVPVRDTPNTCRACRALLNDPDLRQKLRRNARDICRHKDVATRIEKTVALYSGLIR